MSHIPLRVSDDIQAHLNAIGAHFKAPKITLVVRNPTLEDADLILTDDEPRAAIAAIWRLCPGEE